MDKLDQAIGIIHEVDYESSKGRSRMSVHPLARFFVVFAFLLITVSFTNYDNSGLASMVLFLIATMMWEEISFIKGLKRCGVIMGLLFLVGIANPLLDREVVTTLGGVAITGGMISFLTLYMKGAFAVLATYCLIAMVGMDGICYALQCLHIPRLLIDTIAMTYRYIVVLLKEAQKMWHAYHLRAPKQKGLHYKAWGSFVGLLLLHSIDRAKEIYQCMELRGYKGEYRYVIEGARDTQFLIKSSVYVVLWIGVFMLLRIVPVFALVGGLLS